MTTHFESQKFLELVQNCGASDEGARFVRQSVDPFHDVDLDVVGMPDATSGRSLLYSVTQNLGVTTPGAAGSGKWDCHIAFTPRINHRALEACPVTQTAGYNEQCDLFTGKGPTTMPANSLVTVCSTLAGGSTFFGESNESYSSLGIGDYLDNASNAAFRVVGAAFEITNTTESLYKSGAITAYKCDLSRDSISAEFVSGANNCGAASNECHIIHGPPTSEPDAKLMNGVTWAAADGALIPCVMERDNQPQKHNPRLVLTQVEYAGDTRWWTQEDLADRIMKSTGTANTLPIARKEPDTVIPYMLSGAYLTGLSEQTSLTVTMRCFIEVFPLPGNALVPLAHPSPPLDDRAVQCLSEIMAKMLPGYQVHDNAAGDYFRKALAVLKNKVLPVAAVMPGRIGNVARAVEGGVMAGEAIAAAAKGKKAKKPAVKK